ncbi:MAG TPA: hypothetical protein VK879_00485 [Candidatus Sulfomarinibacteraceae bacterium]|nr:hypothetical protein [Candidatus Sulfomarinibacteraceae bacterium]
MRRSIAVLFVLVALLAGALIVQSSAAAPNTFPEIIPVPDGWAPEGVVTGRGHTLYVGSLATGGIYEVDLRTGQGQVVVTAPEERIAVGLAFDRRSGLLFAAGQMAGEAYVYDPDTGASVAEYNFTDETSFVNDAVVTRDAVYFTDSFRPVIYRVPLGPGGSLPDPADVEEIALGGDFELVEGFNVNGIEATPNGKWLIIVQSATGTLYRVDPVTGQATAIDLGGENVANGDGILLQGHTLYVVQNFLNQIAVVELDPALTSGEVVDHITHEAFDIPTTVAGFGPYLYAVNARFTTTPGPDVAYDVVQVKR